jgi:uncharacterized membrane protein
LYYISDKYKKIIFSTEGKLLLTSFFLTILLSIYIFYCWIYDTHLYQTVVAIVASDLFFGRAAGISIGYAMDLDTTTIVVLTMAVESITVFMVYSLFLLSWNQLFVMQTMQTSMQKIKDIATKYHPYIERYGVIGLLCFVFFPFWMTGPTVGIVISYLMGFSHTKGLSIVLSSTLVAILCWAFFIREIQEYLDSINENAFLFVIFAIVVIIVISYIIKKYKSHQRE